MPIQIDGSAGTITGISTGGLPDGCVDTDTLANNAVTAAKSTGLGISEVDQWRLSQGGTLTSDGTTQFTANWERGDTNSQGTIGTGMTESSGVFTFPSTGIWQITAQMSFKRNSGDNRFAQYIINVTTDNSSYTNASSGFAVFPSAYNTTNAIANFIFDVTETTTHKVKFSAYTNRSSVLFIANTSAYEGNSVTFTRLGDT